MRKRYIVNPEDRVVVAMYDDVNAFDDAYEEVIKSCSHTTRGLFNCPMMVMETAGDPSINTLKALSRCDEVDTFDEKIGKDIAGAKLDMKRHLKFARQYDRYLGILEKAMGELYKLAKYHRDKARAIQDDLDRTYNN